MTFQKTKHLISGCFLWLTLTHCVSPDSIDYPDSDMLFSIQSILDDQKLGLSGKRLKKTVVWEGESETQMLTIDSVLIARELAGFESLELQYEMIRSGYIKQVDGFTVRYSRKLTENKGPLFVQIETSGEANTLIISGKILKANFLYVTEKTFELELDSAGLLLAYDIGGFQKLIFKDTVSYRIAGEVLAD